jgi:hypothetical protein
MPLVRIEGYSIPLSIETLGLLNNSDFVFITSTMSEFCIWLGTNGTLEEYQAALDRLVELNTQEELTEERTNQPMTPEQKTMLNLLIYFQNLSTDELKDKLIKKGYNTSNFTLDVEYLRDKGYVYKTIKKNKTILGTSFSWGEI